MENFEKLNVFQPIENEKNENEEKTDKPAENYFSASIENPQFNESIAETFIPQNTQQATQAYQANQTMQFNQSFQNEPPVYVLESTTAPRKKVKKGRLKAVIAASLAVVILGGSSGFGGAYFGNKFFESNNTTPLQIPENTSIIDYMNDGLYLSSDTLTTNTNSKEMIPSVLFEEVSDTVVGIKLYYETLSYNRQVTTESSLVGSGVIFTTDGYVLTNYHVITDYEKIGVVVSKYDGTDETIEYEAEIVGKDESTDLAILKINRDEPFKAASIGESSTLKIGQFVCAIGYPLDMGKSMTYGIVSGLNREVEASGFELSSIQIDAAVNMGNSGGPLFDMYGNIVGIVNKKLIYDNLVENMGFAITIDEAKPIINDLLAYGEVTSRPILGITTQALNEYTAGMLGVDITQGLYVATINNKAPVAKSGLAIGDIIIKVNGKDVTSVADVQTLTKSLKAGDTIEATIVRYSETGKKYEVDITIELTSEQNLQ